VSDHILFAHLLSPDGTGVPLEKDNIGQALRSKSLSWVHLDADHEDTNKWLSAELGDLDPFMVSALIADETRPRMTQINDCAIVILRGVNLNTGEEEEDMVSVRLFIDKFRILSLQKRKLRSIDSIKESVEKGKGPKQVGAFLSRLIGRLTERFESVLAEKQYPNFVWLILVGCPIWIDVRFKRVLIMYHVMLKNLMRLENGCRL